MTDWKTDLYAPLVVKSCVSAVVGWMAGLDIMIKLLLIAMAVDIATGIIRAFIEGRVDSSISRRGIGKKGIMLIVVLGADAASRLSPVTVTLPPFGELSIGAALAAFYLMSETISVIENTSPYIPYPPAIVKKFMRVAKKAGAAQ